MFTCTPGRRLHAEGILLFALLSFLAYTRLYEPNTEKRIRAVAREVALRNEVNDYRARLSRMESKLDALMAGDRETIEQAVREELGWGREGEVVITRGSTRTQR